MLIHDAYKDVSISFLTGHGPTTPIPVLSGVKQSCPISGITFAIAIDLVLRKLQGDTSSHKMTACSDDIVLLVDNPMELQRMLNTASSLFSKLALKFNPKKCKALCLGRNVMVRLSQNLLKM